MHIVAHSCFFVFCRIPVVLESRRSSAHPCTLPLDPPLTEVPYPRTATETLTFSSLICFCLSPKMGKFLFWSVVTNAMASKFINRESSHKRMYGKLVLYILCSETSFFLKQSEVHFCMWESGLPSFSSQCLLWCMEGICRTFSGTEKVGSSKRVAPVISTSEWIA